MTASRAPGGAYEGAGRQVAVALRGYSSVLVTSDDVIAAAHTAIGIALGESAHRLVMLGDLAGEVAPLQVLVKGDDAHGIYDSFEFGTSFMRVAREVEGAKNMFVMPSGTESAATEQILSSRRWRSFASEFANADELLLLVAHSDSPGLAQLVAQLDGVVLVGIQRLPAAPAANILARIPHPVVAPPPKIDLAPTPAPADLSPLKIGIAAAALLTIGVLGGATFKMLSGTGDSGAVPAAADSVAAEPAAPVRPVVLPANPQDSLEAMPYSVEILAANTSEGANFEMNRHGAQMPAATISLVPIGDTEATWYKVHAGAYTDSAEAETLLATLRRRRIVPESAGSIIRAPFALLVDSVPAQAGMTARVRERIRDLSERGVFAYALMQSDGSARIYAGAFGNPEQASLAATALRVAGLSPVLEYRTGRLP
ncbi:MAG: SPOR domain-containing protein [Gemmatimonadaceae bacterium]